MLELMDKNAEIMRN